jgi:hypothetical protein
MLRHKWGLIVLLGQNFYTLKNLESEIGSDKAAADSLDHSAIIRSNSVVLKIL